MNGLTNAFLAMTARPEVGGAALREAPAFVFAADGTCILWANAAGMAFFEAARMGDLLSLRLSSLNPLVRQVARLSRLLPTDAPRLEMLRIGRGTRLTMLAAACRRLNLADGERAVLAVGTGVGGALSLRARAERLTEAIAARDCLAAVMDTDGRVLAASGGVEDLAHLEAAIDDLIEAVSTSGKPFDARALSLPHDTRPAGAARIPLDDGDGVLVIVGPPEAHAPGTATAEGAATEPEPAAATPSEPEPEPEPQPAPAPSPDVEPAPATGAEADDATAGAPEEPPARIGPVLRFVWESDDDGRLAMVSPPLAHIVGDDNAALAGRTWGEIDDILGLGLPDTFPDDDAEAHVYWPVAGSGEAVATDLAALAGGRRGFGVLHPDNRRADTREVATTLAEPVHTETEPPAPPSDDAPTDAASPSDDRGAATRSPPDTGDDDGNDIDKAARRSVERGADRLAAARSNVVPLGRSEALPPHALAGHEQEAFRRIRETLASDEAADSDAAGAGKPAASPIRTAILDRVPVGLFVFRGEDTLFANRQVLELLGYDDTEQLAAAGGLRAVFPDQRDWTGRNLTGVGGRLFAARRDGGTVAVDVRLHAVDWAGETALMLSLSADAGDAEADDMAAELAAAAARLGELEAVLDTATDGVVVIDREGRIASLNHAAEALFGVESSDLTGAHFISLLAEESHRPALDYLDGLAANGVESVLNDGREVIGKVPRGGLIPLFMTMGRIGDGNTFCAVLRDITHWKNVEEELIAAKREAETANQQKSEFLAKVSHEIRTPLNAIIGFSEVMMEERFGPIGNDRYRSYIRDIHTSGGHLMSLINDLLDLSKIEAGKMDLTFEAVPVNTVIQECVALMQPQANRERIIIRTSLSGEVPNVVADQRSIRQILLNLMSNAIKFTRAGGQVIVSTGLEENGEVVLRIRDTGVGMSEKDVAEALQPFKQLATSKRQIEKGTGLGLPLTKALVEANRASFAIDSAPDQGTLIRITFPTTRVLAG